MRAAGIICEFNPLHKGHAWMMSEVRRQGAEAIVCAMSGNFVQRGEAAVADKFARAGFHATKSAFVDAPLIDELPMALECEVLSYDTDTCRLVGRVVNVSADESILGENGKIDAAKLQPITYDTVSHTYRVLGEAVGRAFHDGLALK